MKCKYCGKTIKEGQEGYYDLVDDLDRNRMKELGLKKEENLCHSCKREIMFAGLAPLLI